jgi:CHAT domain-containing protein/tetratricopeptide (TPR) repeat protein
MPSWSAQDLVLLTTREFADPEEAIATLEAAIQAEAKLDRWPVTENRQIVRAKLASRLGAEYRFKRRQGEPADNLEKALTAFLYAMDSLPRDAPPLFKARGHYILAGVYRDRVRGDRADNIERAIELLQSARTVIRPETFPNDWAMTQYSLAEAYRLRIRGERARNIERAIALYQTAMTVHTRRAFPTDWALIQSGLAAAYKDRICDERADNLESAIAHHEAALTVFTRRTSPMDWAAAKGNLAIAYLYRIRGERADNLEHVIALIKEALTVHTREASPIDWAKAQQNLAIAYSHRIRGDPVENTERAIALLEAALTVHTREASPIDWAKAQHNLAFAYLTRVRGDRADNIERAIAILETLLTVRTREASPIDWAETQNSLAVAHAERIRGELADNIEHAITHFEAALTVRTREAFPLDWAHAQHNLGAAYSNRIRGDRAENLKRAIAHHEAALTVLTSEAFPLDWAKTLWSLAVVHSPDNPERAIALYEAVSTIYTREAFPADWAQTQYNVGNAYLRCTSGDRADNIERAITLFEAALAVYTRDAFPTNWAATRNNLAIAYWFRVSDDRADNVRRAIALFESTLTVYTREALPRDQLDTSQRLGQALLTTRNWTRSSAILADARKTFLMLLGQGLDEAEARGLIETAGPLFTNAAYAAAELGDAEQAFALACEGKARLLATALRLQTLGLDGPQRRRLDELRTAIGEQLRLLDWPALINRSEVLERLAQLRRELSRLIAESEARADETDTMALAKLLVADGGAILVPVVTAVGGKLLLVTAGPDRPVLTRIDLPELTTDRLGELIYGEAIGGRYGSATGSDHVWLAAVAGAGIWQERKQRLVRLVEAIGQDLWSLFAAPLASALGKLEVMPGSRLMFLPPASLGFLPLGLAQEPSSGRRLIEDYDIVYAPSLTALAKAHQQVENYAAPSLAAVVNPTGDLPFTRIEGALVEALFDADSRLVLREDDERTAWPEAVLAALKGKSYWHFSTHGSFDRADARQSALALKNGARLTVGNLMGAQDLGRPRLVVLSACATGLHDIHRTPEEFIGLAGAFMTVGAAAVVGTLWPVSDVATALLTARFYDLHLTEALPPAMALRRAQLWLRDATRTELAAYAQGRLDAAQTRQLEQGVGGAAANSGEAAARGNNGFGAQPAPSAARPFAHPVYWGAFVLTGI